MREMKEAERFMMPGKVYDVVRHHEDVSFDKARHLIRKSKVKVIESSGNVFRRVIPPLSDAKAHEILQQAYTSTKKESLKLTSLTKISNDGLYESSSQRFYGSTSDRLNKPAFRIPDILVELECLYESIVQNLGDGQTSLQGFSLANPPPSQLSSFPYHTCPQLNARLEAKLGVNLPVFRLGTRGSLEELHKTLGLLDRVDVLHWGACRLWLVVQLNFQRALELRLAHHLTRRGGYPSWCPMPTYHRQFALTPSLLRKWTIPFEIIVQMPGDLVHLRDWVPHQVIDLGANVSETVSVGSAEWNMNASGFLNCPCGTRSRVGDNDFGGNRAIFARVELMVPRSRPMPCTHVAKAVEAALKERGENDDEAESREYSPSDRDRVPVLKEYRKSTTTRSKSKCYACGKRAKNLKAHLSRHIVCRAKLNLARDEDDNGEEPATDESDEEFECDGVVEMVDYEATYHCAFCTRPFEMRRLVSAHAEKEHRTRIQKRKADDDAGLVVKRRRTKNL